MENIQEIKNNTVTGIIWRFSERILAQLINFVVSIVLARVLFPEEYGIVAIVTIFIAIANSFVTNGLGASLVQKKDADETDFSTIFYSSIAISIILYSIIFFIAPIISKVYSNQALTLVLRIMGLRIPIAAINSVQQAYVSRKMIYKKFFFSTLVGTIISGIVGIVLALSGAGVWALVVQYLLNAVMDTIILFITIEWRPRLVFSFIKFKELFSYGWKVMITGVIGTIFDQLRSFVIGIKYTATDLAYYNRGEQIPSLLYNNVNTAFESVLFSAISKIQENKLAVKNALSKIIKIISYVMNPIMIGIAIVSEPLVEIILTDKWLECIPYLRIICFQYCFSIIGNVNLQALKAICRSDILLKLEFIKKPLYLIFIIISMQISHLAIVLANLIYGFLALIINAVPNKKFLNYSFKDQISDMMPSFLLACFMGIICYMVTFLDLSLFLTCIIQIIVGIIVYIVLSILFKMEALHYIINIEFIKNILKRILTNIRKIRTKFFGLKFFKIRKNKIVFDNFLGKGYGCNPKYIAEEIIKQGLDYDLVWLVEDMKQEFPKEIRKVKFGSMKALYELATAKVWIDNVRNYKGVDKKKEQYYIQTWHGGIGLKAVEGDAQDTLSKDYIKDAQYDGSIIDLFITNNKEQEEYIKNYFWYSGKIMCCGTPRCDIIYNSTDTIKEKVYSYFNIPKSKKIVLYAPTFRKNNNLDVYKFDYIKCCKNLEKKFGSEFIMLIRLHPNISDLSNQIQYDNTIKNATGYADIQELLSVVDVVITDYSSLSFDAGLVYKPVFLLAKDLEEYKNNDRKLIYKLEDIPFEISTTEDELYKKIIDFSEKKYKKRCEKFYNKIGIVNNINSSKIIVEEIKERIESIDE